MADERSPSLITGFVFTSDVPPQSNINVKAPRVNTPIRRRPPQQLSPLLNKTTPQSAKQQKKKGKQLKGGGNTGKKEQHGGEHGEECSDIKADILAKAPYEEQLKLSHPEGKTTSISAESINTTESDIVKKPETVPSSPPISRAAKIVNAVKYLFSPSQEKPVDKKEDLPVEQIIRKPIPKDTLGSSRLLKIAVLQSVNSKRLTVDTAATAEAIEAESKSKTRGTSKIVQQVSLGNRDAKVDRHTVHVNIAEEQQSKSSPKAPSAIDVTSSTTTKPLPPTKKESKTNVAFGRPVIPRIGSTGSARSRTTPQGRNGSISPGAKDDSSRPTQHQIRKRSSKMTSTSSGSTMTSRETSSARAREPERSHSGKREGWDLQKSNSHKPLSNLNDKTSANSGRDDTKAKTGAEDKISLATEPLEAIPHQFEIAKGKVASKEMKSEVPVANKVTSNHIKGSNNGGGSQKGLNGITREDLATPGPNKSSAIKNQLNGASMKLGKGKQALSKNNGAVIKPSGVVTANNSNVSPPKAVVNKSNSIVTPSRPESVVVKPKPKETPIQQDKIQPATVKSDEDKNTPISSKIQDEAALDKEQIKVDYSALANLTDDEIRLSENVMIENGLYFLGSFGTGLDLDDMVERSQLAVYYKTLEDINDEMDYNQGNLGGLVALTTKLETLQFRLTWIQRRATAAIVTLRAHEAKMRKK